MSKSNHIATSMCLSLIAAAVIGLDLAHAQQLDEEELQILTESRPVLQPRTLGVSSAPTQRENIAATPAQTGVAAQIESEPFEGAGFRLGTMRGTIELEQQIGHASNASDLPNGEPGFFSRTSGALSLTSDWQRHQLQITASGNYRRPFEQEQPGLVEANTAASFRMDLRDGITLTSQINYAAASQSFSSPGGARGVSENPLLHTYGGSIELERDIGMFATSLRGEISRDLYENATRNDGSVIDNSDLNDVEYGLTARLGYNLSPALTPFIEGRYALRERDQRTDRGGTMRNATIMEFKAGLEFDRAEKLTGEFAVGYTTERFEDAGLDDLTGFTVSSSLNWSPYRETTVAFDLTTSTNPALGGPSNNGSLVYDARLSVERNLTERLTATGFAGYEHETGSRGSTTTEFGIGAEYHLTRALSATADLEFTNFDSEVANSDYRDTSVLLGLKWQR